MVSWYVQRKVTQMTACSLIDWLVFDTGHTLHTS